MNAAQLHLLFNHWPIVLIAIGFFSLLYGEASLRVSFKKQGLLLFILAAVFAAFSQLTGGGAEEVLEATGIVDHELHEIIERHAGFGFWTAVFSYGIGIFSLISLIMIDSTHRYHSWLRKFILLAAGLCIIALAMTAHTGGEISHPEIRMNVFSQ